jgi:Two component regulator propeller
MAMARVSFIDWLWFRPAPAVLMLGCDTAGIALATSSSLDPYGFQSWQSDDGLPNNNVEAMAQADDGCLWAGNAGVGPQRMCPE